MQQKLTYGTDADVFRFGFAFGFLWRFGWSGGDRRIGGIRVLGHWAPLACHPSGHWAPLDNVLLNTYHLQRVSDSEKLSKKLSEKQMSNERVN
jgi:hypothetical protein